MDWSLCIATLNRRTALLRTLAHALAQTVPPAQIVVVDASDDWEATAAAFRDVLADRPEIALDYGTSATRSSATQRNAALARATHDIVFMIDDDSFMHPTCAEEILKVYADDPEHRVACISARLVEAIPDLPGTDAAPAMPDRKASGRRGGAGLKARVLGTAPGRWINRRVLLQSATELFLRYDGDRARDLPATVTRHDVAQMPFMAGSAMTVRRAIALREPFDTALRYYAAFEDLDFSYRCARHGAVLRAERAHLHHFEAAGGRIKRTKIVLFQLLNMAVFLKRHAAAPEAWRGPYRRLVWRRLLGETLKDLIAGRTRLPQARGALTALRHWRRVWAMTPDEIDARYPDIQKHLLEEIA